MVAVKLCYALRRGVFFPSARDEFGEMPPRDQRREFLPLVKAIGFDAVEVGVEETADEHAARRLAGELADHGLAIGAVRAGGALNHPLTSQRAYQKLQTAIRYAAWIGAEVVNTALVSPPTYPSGPGAGRQGEQVSQGASRTASEQDFALTAERLRAAGHTAAELHVSISIEVHQGSIADNSTATLHLLDMVGLPNVGANPDLGNIYWHYEHPEETPEAAILALAPRAVYWHCKNLRRQHIPELRRSFFQRVPLPDGDIDYRFAIAAMVAAGFDGYLAIEGAREGDALSQDRRGAEYAQRLLAEIYQGSALPV
jgi:sugar phosphate isomerase/epimerase